MASLLKKPSSPFWYLQWKDGKKWKKSSTGLRWDNPNDTAAARELRAKHEAKEYRSAATVTIGWDWVPKYLKNQALSPRTLERYTDAWNWMGLYLTTTGIDVPKVTYSLVSNYIEWRLTRKKKNGKRSGRNTAILEVKLLASLLNESVRRGYIAASPLAVLKLRRDPPKAKREFTDEEIEKCREALKDEPAWMGTAFEISLCTGCRLRDTRIPLNMVVIDTSFPTMTFPCPKGGENKSFSIPVPKQLIPMFRRMKSEGRIHTIDEFPFQPSRRWQQFFQKVKIEGVCFHSLRVTKVTRLRREGVPREAAMRLVNHSSELIHMLYDRHQVRDLAQWADIGIAGNAASTA